MKALKIIAGIVVGLILIIAVVFFVVVSGQPAHGGLEDSIVINAPAELVYEEVINIKKLDAWSPWHNLDPESFTYEGPEEGIGATSKWNSVLQDLGTGSLTIVEAIPNQGIKTKMDFGGMAGDFSSTVDLEPQGEQTKVTWGYTFENMDALGRFFVGLMDIEKEMRPMFQQGLNDLKNIVEAKPKGPFTQVDVEPIYFLGLSRQMNLPSSGEISEAMGEMYGQIMQFMQENSVEMSGQPLTVYTSMESSSLDMTAGIPIEDSIAVDHESITLGSTFKGKAIKAVHKGDYKELSGTYDKLNTYLSDNNYELADHPYEVYVTDPGVVTDTSQWITHIFYPIQN